MSLELDSILRQSKAVPVLRAVVGFHLCCALFLSPSSRAQAQAEDLSEALRLWKFTYQLELTAYGVQYMSADLLQKAGDQLETAAGQTVVTSTPMTVCIEASNQLAKYFRLSTPPIKVSARAMVRENYETARAGCMRLLGADPSSYPLGWPN